MLLVLFNGFSGYHLTDTFKETFPPSLLDSLGIDQSLTLTHIVLSGLTLFSILCTLAHIHSVVKTSKDLVFALLGLLPIVLFFMIVVFVFDTDYAYEH